MSDDTQTCIGLMSGTSSDAIDAVLIEIADQGRKVQVIATHSEPIEPTLQEKIRTVSSGEDDRIDTVHALDTALAEQFAKAANQVIVGLNIGAVAEALTLAKKAGADPARVRQALAGGFADSRILEIHGQRMVDGTFDPGGKCTTQRKDLSQALELAQELGLELPATALNMALYDKVIEAGHGSLDHSALIKAIDPD